ncbi:MAG: hypothetical protein ONB53_21820 [candidate division KSB1 bacterium]|nr:hypothetical protein [candidate division KSB1 bacterium]MDZ7300459.1 hypothetical protein [candidate division KSB1 bacterium]MDZ7308637.1 hypothetical protein [candidate division KSB1 bacterium]MDZ7351439.1 hypothetical protein [candidate division KSB1 bacterium]MDZ7355798.1 hypothetical protein [candidate division KSB1 bacterium]
MLTLGSELSWPSRVLPALFLLWGWGFAILAEIAAAGAPPRLRDLPLALLFLVAGFLFEKAFELIVEGLRLAWAAWQGVFVLLLVMLAGGGLLLRSFFPGFRRFLSFIILLMVLAILFSVWSPGRRLGTHLAGYCVGFSLTLLTRRYAVA